MREAFFAERLAGCQPGHKHVQEAGNCSRATAARHFSMPKRLGLIPSAPRPLREAVRAQVSPQ